MNRRDAETSTHDNPNDRDYRWQSIPVPRAGHTIWAARCPGAGSTVIFLHGFPDNHHLYDDVVAMLPGQDLVVFDFLGSGDSDKPHPYPYTFDNLTGDIDAVVTHLDLDQVVFVAHDISGPPVINWSLDHPDKVDGLVLLNTYYGQSPTMTAPEIIRVFTARTGRRVQSVIRSIAFARPWFEPVYRLQLRRMIGDRQAASRFLDLLVAPFKNRPSQRHAFIALADDMHAAIAAETARVPEAQRFTKPVLVAFGDQDYSLDVGVAEHLVRMFPRAIDAPVVGSRHFPQLTHPHEVADRVRTLLDLTA